MNNEENIISPDGLIVFISGVPGIGKTTISYRLLKKYNSFRIIEETDLIREVLRGYNEFLKKNFGKAISFVFDNIIITDHNKLLSLNEAKTQCNIMRNSFEYIIKRQQRKGISSIINGVHIIPEVLINISENIIFINLYLTREDILKERIKKRNPTSYMLSHIPFIFKTNIDLFESTEKIMKKNNNVYNINVTNLNENDVIDKIIECIKKSVLSNKQVC